MRERFELPPDAPSQQVFASISASEHTTEAEGERIPPHTPQKWEVKQSNKRMKERIERLEGDKALITTKIAELSWKEKEGTTLRTEQDAKISCLEGSLELLTKQRALDQNKIEPDL